MGFTNGDRLRAPDPQLKEIVGTEKELDALSKYFLLGDSSLAMKQQNIISKKLVPDYDIVHLAIHGRGDPERSYSSSLFSGH